MNALGIDIGGTSVKLAIMDHQGAFSCAQSTPYLRPTTQQIIAAIVQAAQNIGFKQRPDSIGMCVPGLLDRTLRRITASVNVPGLVDVPLDDLVRQANLCVNTITLANDAVATAYDLFHTRRLMGRLLVLAIGTGVGAAVLDDGQPLYVEGESPGHIGQIDVSLEEAPLGPDGGAGGLEAYIGSAALDARYGVVPEPMNMAVDDLPIRALVRAIRISHALYRPHHICLAGGMGQRLAPLIPAIKQRVEVNLTRIARRDWSLISADNYFHAARGAARLSIPG